jgi:guanylate kinase
VDYHFFSETEFERRVQADEFLEHAVVHGHRYGTLKQEVLERLRSGLDVILNIDVQGAATVRSRAASDSTLAAALVTVFLTVPSVAVLETRLRSRAQDSEEVIQRRLSAARQEAARWREFDYLIVSGSKEEDLLRLKAIVTAERLRRHRVTAPQL